MRQVTYEVYEISELEGKAKERALEQIRINVDYPWYRENQKSLEAFTIMFPIKVNEWEYSQWGKHALVTFGLLDDEYSRIIREFSGTRLWKYLQNNYQKFLVDGCAATGYYMDDVLMEPILSFMKKPTNITFFDLLEICVQKWLDACQKDYDEFYKDSALEEYAFENDMEFYENGQYFRERSLLNVLPSDHNQV